MQSYECTVVGGGFTEWQGSALACESRLSLRHSQFKYGTAREECNNGAVVVRAIGETDDNFTSQLNLTVSPDMNNKSVECIYNNGTTRTIVGISTLIITTGTHEP